MTTTLNKVPKKKNIDLLEPLKERISNFRKRFEDGSIGTKLSHFIFGAGNFYHKQYVKGAIFLLLQIAIIRFMVFSNLFLHIDHKYRHFYQ